jgi:hypothetical protein
MRKMVLVGIPVMSVEISQKNEVRLIATAQAEGVSVDTFLELLMNEREQLMSIVERAAARVIPPSYDEMHAKIERGFLQSENGEVVDGETFSAKLLAELDDMEHKRRVG